MRPVPIKKKQMTLLWILLAVVIVIMVLLSKCTHRPSPTPSIHPITTKSGGDTIDVAIEISPLSYHVSGDTVAGLDYSLMNEVMRIGRRPVKFHPFAPLDYATRGLDAGTFDIVVSFLPSTSGLKTRYLLTDPIYLDREVLVQRCETPNRIVAPENLAGDTVWIAAGSPFEARIRNLGAEIGDTIHIERAEGRSAEHLVMLVARGEIPRAVVNAGLARRMRDTYPDLDIATNISFTQFQTWMLSKHNTELRDSLNTWIDSLRRSHIYGVITGDLK